MESCFHSGESSGCHNHGPLRGDSDVQNCSSIRHSSSLSLLRRSKSSSAEMTKVMREASKFSLGVASPLPPYFKSQNIPPKGLGSGLRYVRVRYKSMEVRTGPQIFEPKPSRFALCESLLS
jgi:hypothetical protein